MIPAFILYGVLAMILFFQPENWDEVCEYVVLKMPHHFVIDDKYGCDIRWMYLLGEPIFLLSIFGYILIGIPYLLKKFVERRL